MIIAGSTAYVVFENNVTLWWLHILRKGYRHCKIYVQMSEKIYLEVNPLSNQTFIFLHFFENHAEFKKVIHKSCFIKTKIMQSELKSAPIGAFTCVEVVKRILGIHNFWIITPLQLYNFLIGCRKKVLTK